MRFWKNYIILKVRTCAGAIRHSNGTYLNLMLVFLLCFSPPWCEEVGEIIVEGWNKASRKLENESEGNWPAKREAYSIRCAPGLASAMIDF